MARGVCPNARVLLKLRHVDPATARMTGRAGDRWSASTPGWSSLVVAGGQLHLGRTITVVTVVENLETLMKVVKLQQRVRAKLHERAMQRAYKRELAAAIVQRFSRGFITRKPSSCPICLDEVPFAAMVSTVPSQRCHRTCRRCAVEYVNTAINDGRLYICCPGESCTHLMIPEDFASAGAKATYREALRASHGQRLKGEGDKDFLSFCKEHARQCPACGVLIYRHAGCNHMQCRCGHNFDWTDVAARVEPVSVVEEPRTDAVSAALRRFEEQVCNHTCFDCGAHAPMWVSLSHGTAICLHCAGMHRALGVETSRVRSLHLDSFTHEEAALLELSGGNGEAIKHLKLEPQPQAHDASASHSRASDEWARIIEARYTSAAAQEYRRRLTQLRIELQFDLNINGRDETMGRRAIHGASIRDGFIEEELMQRADDRERALREVRGGTRQQHNPPPPQANLMRSSGWHFPSTRLARIAQAQHHQAQHQVQWDARAASRLEAIDRLVLMGFEAQRAREALERHQGDVAEAAIDLAHR